VNEQRKYNPRIKRPRFLFIFAGKTLYFPIENQGILVVHVKFEGTTHRKIRRLGELYFETELVYTKDVK